MKTIYINNRIENKTMYSDYVYPDLVSDNRLLKKVVQIDDSFVTSVLHMLGVDRIANKYVIKITYMGNQMYWYQHDNKTWLLQKVI